MNCCFFVLLYDAYTPYIAISFLHFVLCIIFFFLVSASYNGIFKTKRKAFQLVHCLWHLLVILLD